MQRLKKTGGRAGRRRSPIRKAVTGGRKNWVTGRKLSIYQKSNVNGGSAVEPDSGAQPDTSGDADFARALQEEEDMKAAIAESLRTSHVEEAQRHNDESKYDSDEPSKHEEPSLDNTYQDVMKSFDSSKTQHDKYPDPNTRTSTNDGNSDDSDYEPPPEPPKKQPEKKPQSSKKALDDLQNLRSRKLVEIYGDTQQLKAQQDEIRRENQRLMTENKKIATEHQRMNAIRDYDRDKEYRIQRLLWDLIPVDSYYRTVLKDKINEILRRELLRETKTNDVKIYRYFDSIFT